MIKRGGGIAGKIITVIFLLISLIFAGLMVYTKMIPAAILAVVSVGLLILVFLVGILTWNRYKLGRFFVGTFLAAIMSIAYILAGCYVYKTTSTILQVSGVNKEITQMGIYVRTDDAADSIDDAAEYTFGILSELDRENTDGALKNIKEKTGKDVAVQEYRGLSELVDGLTHEQTGAIILNQAYLDVIKEMDGYSNLDSVIRQIAVENVETTIKTNPSAGTEKKQHTVSEKKGEVYTIYVSGIDNRGGIVAKSRSDVNIIVTANTATGQILLVSTPRDYYVPLSISNGVPDKLTHAGIYGINVCMDTLGMLYDIDINYFVRLNFDGFINIIDALGGITINSDYEFTSKNVAGYHFNKGENFVNGEQALAFARERYAFSEGDRQRGKNQMAVIKGVVDKALSPELLNK